MEDAAPAWALVEQLASRDLPQRMQAVASLRALGTDAAPALERGLAGHTRPEVRRWCAHLLQQAHRRASASAIVAATNDPFAAVRLLALQALAGGSEQLNDLGLDPIPLLLRLARQDRSKRVRRAALQHLTQCLHDPRARAVLAEGGIGGGADAPRRRFPWVLPAVDRSAVAVRR